jgi:hypothetical protein
VRVGDVKEAGCQWLMPVIPAYFRIQRSGRYRGSKAVHKTLFEKIQHKKLVEWLK